MWRLFLFALALPLAMGGPLQRSAALPADDIDGSFPLDVGYPGPGGVGEVPFAAVSDTLSGSRGNSPYEHRFNATDADGQEFSIWRHMGSLSPYYSSPAFPQTTAKKVLNETCTVKQVHILHRHGARYPTTGSKEGAPLVGKTVAEYIAAGNLTATGPLSFLKKWTYGLGAEYLVRTGAQHVFDSGVYHYQQYGKLFNVSLPHKPVVRTTSQSRMLDGARYFVIGFFGYDALEKINLEVTIEAEGFNSTLVAEYACPGARNISVSDKYLTHVWRKIYTKPAMERLQPYTNIPLTPDLIYGALAACAYQSAALSFSEWCGVFTRAEWEGFEYDQDLHFQGDSGFMSPTGRAQGIGYVQELLDRITSSPFSGPVTSRNATLDGDPTYFPLDQPIYIDFTHDDYIVGTLTALNVTQVADYLDPTKPDPNRHFVLSRIAPFAGRLVTEIIACEEGVGKEKQQQYYVRLLNNEAIIPLDEGQGCGGGGGAGGKRSDGLCPLDDFVKYQRQHAYSASNFDRVCFGVNGTDFTITGPTVRNGTIG